MATIIPFPTTGPGEPPARLSVESIYAELSLLTRRTRALLDGLPPHEADTPLADTVREVDRAWRALTVAQELTPLPEPAAPIRLAVHRVDELVVCTRTRTATASDERLRLTRYEFDLLAVLARDPSAVLTKAYLLREVWGIRESVRTRTLDTHASRLRRLLTTACQGTWVVNHWGIGYSLTYPSAGPVAS